MAENLEPWRSVLDALVGARHGGRTEGLARRLEGLAERWPTVPEIAAEVGHARAAEGDAAGAVMAYEKALALGLASREAVANVGLARAAVLVRLGRAGEAVAALEAARVQFPDFAEVAAYLAVARWRAGAREAAFGGLLDLLVETSEDPGLAAHQRTLRGLVRDA